MKFGKRAINVFLSVVLAAGLLPVLPAYAEEGGDSELVALSNGLAISFDGLPNLDICSDDFHFSDGSDYPYGEAYLSFTTEESGTYALCWKPSEKTLVSDFDLSTCPTITLYTGWDATNNLPDEGTIIDDSYSYGGATHTVSLAGNTTYYAKLLVDGAKTPNFAGTFYMQLLNHENDCHISSLSANVVLPNMASVLDDYMGIQLQCKMEGQYRDIPYSAYCNGVSVLYYDSEGQRVEGLPEAPGTYYAVVSGTGAECTWTTMQSVWNEEAQGYVDVEESHSASLYGFASASFTITGFETLSLEKSYEATYSSEETSAPMLFYKFTAPEDGFYKVVLSSTNWGQTLSYGWPGEAGSDRQIGWTDRELASDPLTSFAFSLKKGESVYGSSYCSKPEDLGEGESWKCTASVIESQPSYTMISEGERATFGGKEIPEYGSVTYSFAFTASTSDTYYIGVVPNDNTPGGTVLAYLSMQVGESWDYANDCPNEFLYEYNLTEGQTYYVSVTVPYSWGTSETLDENFSADLVIRPTGGNGRIIQLSPSGFPMYSMDDLWGENGLKLCVEGYPEPIPYSYFKNGVDIYYYDMDGNPLRSAPAEMGTYQVYVVGNGVVCQLPELEGYDEDVPTQVAFHDRIYQNFTLLAEGTIPIENGSWGSAGNAFHSVDEIFSAEGGLRLYLDPTGSGCSTSYNSSVYAAGVDVSYLKLDENYNLVALDAAPTEPGTYYVRVTGNGKNCTFTIEEWDENSNCVEREIQAAIYGSWDREFTLLAEGVEAITNLYHGSASSYLTVEDLLASNGLRLSISGFAAPVSCSECSSGVTVTYMNESWEPLESAPTEVGNYLVRIEGNGSACTIATQEGTREVTLVGDCTIGFELVEGSAGPEDQLVEGGSVITKGEVQDWEGSVYRYYSFTPSESGFYSIYSVCDSTILPKSSASILVYSQWDIANSCPDESSIMGSFGYRVAGVFSEELVANQTYYVAVNAPCATSEENLAPVAVYAKKTDSRAEYMNSFSAGSSCMSVDDLLSRLYLTIGESYNRASYSDYADVLKVVFYDENRNLLKDRPSAPGSYFIRLVGNENIMVGGTDYAAFDIVSANDFSVCLSRVSANGPIYELGEDQFTEVKLDVYLKATTSSESGSGQSSSAMSGPYSNDGEKLVLGEDYVIDHFVGSTWDEKSHSTIIVQTPELKSSLVQWYEGSGILVDGVSYGIRWGSVDVVIRGIGEYQGTYSARLNIESGNGLNTCDAVFSGASNEGTGAFLRVAPGYDVSQLLTVSRNSVGLPSATLTAGVDYKLVYTPYRSYNSGGQGGQGSGQGGQGGQGGSSGSSSMPGDMSGSSSMSGDMSGSGSMSGGMSGKAGGPGGMMGGATECTETMPTTPGKYLVYVIGIGDYVGYTATRAATQGEFWLEIADPNNISSYTFSLKVGGNVSGGSPATFFADGSAKKPLAEGVLNLSAAGEDEPTEYKLGSDELAIEYHNAKTGELVDEPTEAGSYVAQIAPKPGSSLMGMAYVQFRLVTQYDLGSQKLGTKATDEIQISVSGDLYSQTLLKSHGDTFWYLTDDPASVSFEIFVKSVGRTLVEGIDYVVEYITNAAQEILWKITGQGDFTGVLGTKNLQDLFKSASQGAMTVTDMESYQTWYSTFMEPGKEDIYAFDPIIKVSKIDAATDFRTRSVKVNGQAPSEYYFHVSIDEEGNILAPLVEIAGMAEGVDFKVVNVDKIISSGMNPERDVLWTPEKGALKTAAVNDYVYINLEGMGSYEGIQRTLMCRTTNDAPPLYLDIAGAYVYVNGNTIEPRIAEALTNPKVTEASATGKDATYLEVTSGRHTSGGSTSHTVSAKKELANGQVSEASVKLMVVSKYDLTQMALVDESSLHGLSYNGVSYVPAVTVQAYKCCPDMAALEDVNHDATNLEKQATLVDLRAGKDYTLELFRVDDLVNPIDGIDTAGDYVLKVKGAGNWSGEVTTARFTVESSAVKQSLAKCTVAFAEPDEDEGMESQALTTLAEPVTHPEIVVMLGNTVLTENVDYVIEITDVEGTNKKLAKVLPVGGSDDERFTGMNGITFFAADSGSLDLASMCYVMLVESEDGLGYEPVVRMNITGEVVKASRYVVEKVEASYGRTQILIKGKEGESKGQLVASYTIDLSVDDVTVSAEQFCEGYYKVTVPVSALKEGVAPSISGKQMILDEAAGEWVYLIAAANKDDASSLVRRMETQEVVTDVIATNGDLNGVGGTNIVDAQIAYDIAINNAPAGISVGAMLGADVNGTGNVNALDAFAIQRYVITGSFE